MKLEIFDDSSKREEVLRVKLVIKAGRAHVVAVDENGNEIPGGNIFVIRPDGTGCVCQDVSDRIPIQKTPSGAIKLIGE